MQEQNQIEPPDHLEIHWPDTLDSASFLHSYWQQRPLLIKQALPEFQCPLSAEELAGLAIEPDSSARLIVRDETNRYHLETGPFTTDRFGQLLDNRWSLLVGDVEKQLPELRRWLEPFSFVPQWRVDDLMISYAPDGASVGAHVDEYDVFLLQASGIKTWEINSDAAQGNASVKPGDLKILEHFTPTDRWDLHPGDILYLPPGIAHHGVAKGDNCTTWSIGFRAPRYADMVMRIAEQITEQAPEARYSDGPLSPALSGQITHRAISRFKDAWTAAIALPDQQFAQLIGQWLTEADNSHNDFLQYDSLNESAMITQSGFSRLGWIAKHGEITENTDDSDVWLFADGITHACSCRFAIRLCNCAFSPICFGTLSSDEKSLVRTLITAGSVCVENA